LGRFQRARCAVADLLQTDSHALPGHPSVGQRALEAAVDLPKKEKSSPANTKNLLGSSFDARDYFSQAIKRSACCFSERNRQGSHYSVNREGLAIAEGLSTTIMG
jgi:hypothetical protein